MNKIQENLILNKRGMLHNILSKKSSAQMGFRVNPVLARNSCIQCYISLFTEIKGIFNVSPSIAHYDTLFTERDKMIKACDALVP